MQILTSEASILNLTVAAPQIVERMRASLWYPRLGGRPLPVKVPARKGCGEGGSPTQGWGASLLATKQSGFTAEQQQQQILDTKSTATSGVLRGLREGGVLRDHLCRTRLNA